MSIRRNYDGVSCPRFTPEADPKNAPSGGLSGRKETVSENSVVNKLVATLEAENKALRQQVGEQALEIAKLRGTKKDRNSSGIGDENQAGSKRGRPKLPDDERERRRKQQKADANRKARQRQGERTR